MRTGAGVAPSSLMSLVGEKGGGDTRVAPASRPFVSLCDGLGWRRLAHETTALSPVGLVRLRHDKSRAVGAWSQVRQRSRPRSCGRSKGSKGRRTGPTLRHRLSCRDPVRKYLNAALCGRLKRHFPLANSQSAGARNVLFEGERPTRAPQSLPRSAPCARWSR